MIMKGHEDDAKSGCIAGKSAVDRFFNKKDAALNEAVNLFLKQRPIKRASNTAYPAEASLDGGVVREDSDVQEGFRYTNGDGDEAA